MDVVVDACQMRAGPKTLNAYLERGYMVMVTGSKFFTGPPFSGALLVPRQIGARVKSLPTLPAGFADYSGRSDWPQSWDTICRPLTSYRNLGMLLRWKAAITEMRMFEAVGTVNQHMILSLFMQSAQAAVAAKNSLDLVRGSPLDRSALRKPAGEWDEIPTILPFTLSRRTPDGASHKVDFDDARKVYHWLNTDITTRLPVGISDDERRLAATLCHAGQPVKVGSNDGVGIGALRLCASARIVSRIALDMASGSETLNRLWQSTRDALTMLDKAELIIRHFDHLDAEAAMPQVPVRCAAV